MKRRPASGRTPGKPHLWRQSAEFRAIADAAIRRFNAERHLHPICGAKAKSTGEPCRQTPAKGRNRCRFHGGATPRGDGPAGWHTPGFPNGIPTGKPRSDALKARKRWKRRAEIAAMTAEELARLEAWRHTHKPSSTSDRVYRHHAREARRWLETIMSEAPSAPSPDRAELDMLRARLRIRLKQLDAEIGPLTGGIFD